MTVFALTMSHGPRWDPRRGIRDQQAWDEHASFMDGLVDDGFVILGGPLGHGEQALLMVEAGDEQEVAARMGEDPWAAAGAAPDRRAGTLEHLAGQPARAQRGARRPETIHRPETICPSGRSAPGGLQWPGTP